VVEECGFDCEIGAAHRGAVALEVVVNRSGHVGQRHRSGQRRQLVCELDVGILYLLRHGGILGVWSADRDRAFESLLRQYLDDVETESVTDWEDQFRDYLRDSHGEILDSIREEKQLTDETGQSLRDAIEHFNENYEPEQQSLVNVSVGDDGENGEADNNGSAENPPEESPPEEEAQEGEDETAEERS
jgi:hypothetical protein